MKALIVDPRAGYRFETPKWGYSKDWEAERHGSKLAGIGEACWKEMGCIVPADPRAYACLSAIAERSEALTLIWK